MANVSVLILRAPGTNCDVETAHAWGLAGASARCEHINTLLSEPNLLSRFQILTIPGGFSYGDDVSAGKIMALSMATALGDALRRFVLAGNLILGICNGFQVLVKMGLLPGGSIGRGSLTLAFNASGRFETRWVHVEPVQDSCRFIDGDDLLFLPVAHAEGRVVVADRRVAEGLRESGQVAFRYTDSNRQAGGYPINPNGSIDSIAGLTDSTGQVLGLMPHPERYVHRTHHPFWTRMPADCAPDGLRLFRAAVDSLR